MQYFLVLDMILSGIAGYMLGIANGLVAERVSLRYFLALGMILSGIAGYMLGIAKYYSIHSIPYFMLVQIFGGIVQTTGWPGVVAVMGNWFGKGKRAFCCPRLQPRSQTLPQFHTFVKALRRKPGVTECKVRT
ncbi:hypothetical protein J6590_105406, partial [Homalodisca vitripennis]